MPRLPALTVEDVDTMYIALIPGVLMLLLLDSTWAILHDSALVIKHHFVVLFVLTVMRMLAQWYIKRRDRRYWFHIHASAPGAESKECSICLDGIQNGDQVRTLRCGHKFHAACIDEWLTVRRSCGYCLAPLYDMPDQY